MFVQGNIDPTDHEESYSDGQEAEWPRQRVSQDDRRSSELGEDGVVPKSPLQPLERPS